MEELIIQYAQKIEKFEYDAGESFTDYFMDGEVFKTSWAFWLVGKGYIERGNEIVNEINRRGGPNGWSDQELLFDVHASPLKYDKKDDCYYPWQLDNNEGYEEACKKDYVLWAEFLLSTDRYKKPFLNFIENFEAGREY